jgi:hypothetical protein
MLKHNKYEYADHTSVPFILGKAQRIAESYFFLYNAEQDNPKENSYMIISEMILAGISLELFMKGILKHYSPSDNIKKYGHDLKTLFRSLPAEVQQCLLDNYNKLDSCTKELTLNEFTELLEDNKKVFVQFRYLFEDEYYYGSKMVHPLFLNKLVECFYNYVATHTTIFSENLSVESI